MLQNGADQHIDYSKVNFEEVVSDVDLVLNTVSNEINTRSVTVTKSGGKIIYILGAVPQEILDAAKNKSIEIKSILVQSSGEDMKTIADLMEQGIIKSHISKEFTFDEMASAHLQLATSHTVGKVVVNI